MCGGWHRGRQSHFIHRQSTMGRIRSDKWCQFIIYKAVREARGRRRHPKLHGPFYIFQLVPTLGPSTCVLIPFGVRTPQLVRPFLLEQQLRAQASLANLLFCVGIRVGSLRYIPLEPICIHSLSACTFPVLAIIYLKHYLYSCTHSCMVWHLSRRGKGMEHYDT